MPPFQLLSPSRIATLMVWLLLIWISISSSVSLESHLSCSSLKALIPPTLLSNGLWRTLVTRFSFPMSPSTVFRPSRIIWRHHVILLSLLVGISGLLVPWNALVLIGALLQITVCLTQSLPLDKLPSIMDSFLLMQVPLQTLKFIELEVPLIKLRSLESS